MKIVKYFQSQRIMSSTDCHSRILQTGGLYDRLFISHHREAVTLRFKVYWQIWFLVRAHCK